MRFPSRVVLACLFSCCFFLAVPVWAQSSTVYFSTGNTNPSQIYSLDTSSGTPTLLVSSANADYEGLVVLPDLSADNLTYLVYACDTANSRIIRFNPASPTVYTLNLNNALQKPQCGRGTPDGDLIVTSTVTGANGGWWSFLGIAKQPLGSEGPVTPSRLFTPAANSKSVDEGTAWKNTGDLLIVDKAGSQVLRSSGPISSEILGGTPWSAASAFITTGLSAPVGIARKTTGEIFVSNQGNSTIKKFNAAGGSPSNCGSVTNNSTPGFLQMFLDDTLYAGITLKNGKGQVLQINSATCSTTTFSLAVPAVGIALPPAPPLNLTATTQDQESFTFYLGDSAAFKLQTGGSCSATPTATATETNPNAVQSSINGIPAGANLPNGGTPAVDLWTDGFQIVFNSVFTDPKVSQCAPVPPANLYYETVSTFVEPSQETSPRMVYCDRVVPGCEVGTLFGAYPFGGLLAQDGTITHGTPSNSQFFAINANPATAEPGTFCGFQSPFSSSSKFPYNPQAPNLAGVFSTGSTISVKFKLAAAGGNCKNGPYIQDAVATLAVARICAPPSAGSDPICSHNSQAPVVPANLINIEAEGSSTPPPTAPNFKFGNNQYQFSLSLKGYLAGIYSLNTSFVTGNTTDQVILFQVQ